MKPKFELFALKSNIGKAFNLTPLELKDYIDFDVKRVYYITQPTGDTGQHCHKIEKEFFIMVQGSCLAIIDQGNGKENIPLSGPTSGMYVANYVWHGFNKFSSDAILLALSSTNYRADRSDYVENYDEYLKIRDEKLKS